MEDFEVPVVRGQEIPFVLGSRAPMGQTWTQLEPTTNKGYPKNPKNVRKWLATLPSVHCEECLAGRCKNSPAWKARRQMIVEAEEEL